MDCGLFGRAQASGQVVAKCGRRCGVAVAMAKDACDREEEGVEMGRSVRRGCSYADMCVSACESEV